MADMKINPDEIKEKLEPVSDAVAKAGKAVTQKAEPAVKAVGEKAKELSKAAGEKAAEGQKAVASKARELGKNAEAKVRAAGREATSAVNPIVYIQYGGREIACDDLIERAKADYKANNKGAIRSCKLYVKPEENAAYYVISGKEGKIDL
ncbi:MAG: DUF6465 family protein [Oscillospiraceae bacterium]|jgi:hypothetical protein